MPEQQSLQTRGYPSIWLDRVSKAKHPAGTCPSPTPSSIHQQLLTLVTAWWLLLATWPTSGLALSSFSPLQPRQLQDASYTVSQHPLRDQAPAAHTAAPLLMPLCWALPHLTCLLPGSPSQKTSFTDPHLKVCL
jgi:hypothetical protein